MESHDSIQRFEFRNGILPILKSGSKLGSGNLTILIFVTPRKDTPEALAAYAASQGADTSQWTFDTQDDPILLKTIIGGGFEVYCNQNDDSTFTFDPKFVLVDGWDIVRGEYRYQTTTPDANRILRDKGVLAEEVINKQ